MACGFWKMNLQCCAETVGHKKYKSENGRNIAPLMLKGFIQLRKRLTCCQQRAHSVWS